MSQLSTPGSPAIGSLPLHAAPGTLQDPPSIKRHKITIACNNCRSRKIRCDGKRPICMCCGRDGRTCVYQVPRPKVVVSRDYLDSLTKRISELERLNAEVREQVDSAQPPLHEASVLHRGGTSDSKPREIDERRFSLLDPESLVQKQLLEDASNEKTISRDTDCTVVNGEYFGASSTLVFAETLRSIASLERNHATQPPGLRPLSHNAKAKEPFLSQKLDVYVVPPRSAADYLLETYFSCEFELFPILHEPTCRDKYAQLWLPDAQPDMIWLSTLNMIFALTCLFTDRLTHEDGESAAKTFFTRAQGFFDLYVLDSENLDVIQALLLMGRYLKSTQQVTRCWNIVGIAIRIAQGAGLHVNALNSKCNPLECELRKRCWWGAFLLDTTLSMSFGRPRMVSNLSNDVELPESVDDILITTTKLTPQPKSGPPAKIAMFIQNARLSVILGDILRSLYGSSTDGKDEIKHSEVFQFDSRLRTWYDQLPVFLQMGDAGLHEHRVDLIRQRNVLYSRYLNVRIVLSRPSLTVLARVGVKADPSQVGCVSPLMLLSTAKACVAAAERQIQHIYQFYGKNLLGAAWYNAFFTFHAGTILFAAKISGNADITCTGRRWEDSIDLLARLSQQCSSAKKYLKTLEVFDAHLRRMNSM